MTATAARLADLVAAREVSAYELASAYLARIGASGAALNAVVVTDGERALAAASAVDRAVAAGQPLGPLAGVPVTVKEAFAVAGLPTTAGVETRVAIPTPDDAPAVAALRAAGAVILGKTNVPVNLADFQAANPVYGRTANPWDLERTCGGSSGGGAAAIAASLSALDLGSDLSGSIRVPAAWCGVYGLRGTVGAVSKRGHLPWPIEGLLEPPASVVGPLARSVGDLALAFEVLAGRPRVPARPVAGLRIGVWEGVASAPVGAEVAAVLDAARTALEDAGVVTVGFRAPWDVEATLALGWRLANAEITHGLDDDQWAAVAAVGAGPLVQQVRDHLADQEARLRVAAAWEDALDGLDAVLCPAIPIVAHAHSAEPRVSRVVRDGRDWDGDSVGAWSILGAVAHQPSVTLPAGTGAVSGMPVGVQLVGRQGGDQPLLAVAAGVDEVLGGWQAPPGWG